MQPDTRKPSICFVARNAYNLLAGREDLAVIGGAEVQQVLLARGLRDRGHRVCFVTMDHGQPMGEVIDGIEVYPSYSRHGGVRGLRFVHPRWTGLYKAMRQAGADVYYQRCAGIETGQVALWCRMHGRPFVFGCAHDSNVDPALPALSNWRERLMYRRGLTWANAVIAQTKFQQESLGSHFQRDSILIRNAAASLPPAHEAITTREARRGILWAGRFSAIKRLGWCLDVAEALPEVPFVIAGSAGPDATSNGFEKRFADLSNVRALGYVPHERMGEQFRTAALYLSTSAGEGFPNTFLEAWSRGTPVVSTIDPDGIIGHHGLGRVVETKDELIAAARELLNDAPAWQEASRRARHYVRDHHALDGVLDRFAEVIEGLCPSPTSIRTVEHQPC